MLTLAVMTSPSPATPPPGVVVSNRLVACDAKTSVFPSDEMLGLNDAALPIVKPAGAEGAVGSGAAYVALTMEIFAVPGWSKVWLPSVSRSITYTCAGHVTAHAFSCAESTRFEAVDENATKRPSPEIVGPTAEASAGFVVVTATALGLAGSVTVSEVPDNSLTAVNGSPSERAHE